MGSRIIHAIGFGLTDVRTVDGQIDDPRINSASPLLSGNDIDLPAYRAFAEARMAALPEGDVETEIARLRTDLRLDRAEREEDTPASCAVHAETGLSGVLLLRPVGQRDWVRFDNVIDYVTAEDVTPRVQVLKRSLPPYEGQWMDPRTGRVFDTRQIRLYLGDVLTGDPRVDKYLDAYAQSLGFTDSAELTSVLTTPAVPDPIVELAEFGELFTSPDVIRQLRPLHYVWWS